MDEEELRFVIGHETAHILSGHAVYRTMLLFLTRLATRVAWIPLGYIGLRAIVAGLRGVVPQVRAVRATAAACSSARTPTPRCAR